MNVTARDDGWLRTHDDMRAAIQCEADRLGARAKVERLRDLNEKHVEKLGTYSLTLERVGLDPITIASAYGLPAPEKQIIASVRETITKAARAAEDTRR